MNKNSRAEDISAVDDIRAALAVDFLVLASVQPRVTGPAAAFLANHHRIQLDESDPEDDDGAVIPAPESSPTDVSVERRPVQMPSTATPRNPAHCAVELAARQHHALRHILALRNLIAEKSFQYSHVIRKTAHVAITTRSRSAIDRLNDSIDLHSRGYTRCRDAMIRLNAGIVLLNKFKELHREDTVASAVVMDPNTPGSTSRRLSWIWQLHEGEGSESAEAVNECKWCSALSTRRIDPRPIQLNMFIGSTRGHNIIDGGRRLCLLDTR